MAMTSAERQARYRERLKGRAAQAGETVEAMIERVRQGLLADWFQDARESAEYRDAEDVEREVAFLGRVAGRPLWHAGGFAEWLEMLIAHDVERDIAAARKAEKREASARRRKARPSLPSGRDAAGDPASAAGWGRR